MSPPNTERRPGTSSEAAVDVVDDDADTVTPQALAATTPHRVSQRELRELWDNEILTAWAATGWKAYIQHHELDDERPYGFTAPVIGWALSRVQKREGVDVEVEPIFVDEAGLIWNLSEFRRLYNSRAVHFHLVAPAGEGAA